MIRGIGSNGKERKAWLVRQVLAAMVGLVLLAWPEPGQAVDIALPPLNLGGSSFEDGIAFPGWLVEESIEYYHAGHVNGHAGDEIPGSNQFTTIAAATHIAYLSNVRLLGGFYGAEFVLPLADVDVDTTFGPNRRERGIGDLFVSPFILQWTDQTFFGLPYFHRFVLGATLPTGSYDSDRPVNVGSNMVTVNTYYAFTLLPTQKTELSVRLQYLWNAENDDPFKGLGAEDTQPGQAVHANYAASYQIADGVRVGINGYALQQLTEDKVDGRSQDDSKERVFGIGPGIKVSGNGASLYLSSYFETGAKNRPEGTRVVLRLSKVF